MDARHPQIVVAYDFSSYGRAVLDRAVALVARAPFHVLHMVTVIDPHSGIPVEPHHGHIDYEYADRVRVRMTDEIRKAFEATPIASEIQVFVHPRIGKPADEILDLAKEVGADLILVGTHGHTGLPRLLMGSVAERVVREAGCAVLVARPKTYPDVELMNVIEVDQARAVACPHVLVLEQRRDHASARVADRLTPDCLDAGGPVASITVATRHPQDVLREAVAAAVMAPSSHNTQPWRFRISGATLDIFADPRRHLAVIDPERRQLVQSCGAALFNARVAVRAMGFSDEVTTMLVDGEQPEHVATLHLGAPHLTSDTDHALMEAIARRHTNRREFQIRPIAAADTDVMSAAAAAEGVTMARLVPDQKHGLAHLIEEADERQLGDPAFRVELSRWLAPLGSRRRDGIPFVEKEYGSALSFTLVRSLRSPSLGHDVGKREEALIEGSPAVVVLGTVRDEASDWLACGQALEAVLLHATARGMAAAFLNQVLEIPELRGRVAELVPGIGYPQMVLRIGVPAKRIHHAAPRRELGDVLEIVD
jgi:nucleotide-binding universal stress UspA family protein